MIRIIWQALVLLIPGIHNFRQGVMGFQSQSRYWMGGKGYLTDYIKPFIARQAVIVLDCSICALSIVDGMSFQLNKIL
jgi:hypothetical protein